MDFTSFTSQLPITDPTWIFFLVLLIILFAPLVMGKLHIPHIVGMILAGMLIGKHGLNLLEFDDSFELFGKVGMYYIVFLAGLELDMDDFKKNQLKGITFGLLSFSIPMVIGTFTSLTILHYGVASSLLLASIYASNTLIAYPIKHGELYQVPEGRDYVSANDVYRPGGPNDNSFVNIKLNYGNNWTWDCPVQLPETYQQDGQTKYWNYYVIEMPKDAGQTVSGVVWTNPAYDAISTSSGNLQITVEGYRSRNTVGAGNWNQTGYTTQTEGGDAIETLGHVKYDQPYGAAIGNTGEIQIINKTLKYMQMDLQHHFLWHFPIRVGNYMYQVQLLHNSLLFLRQQQDSHWLLLHESVDLLYEC